MEALAAAAYAALPEHFRNLCKDLVIQIDDFPSDEVLESMNCETEFDIARPVPGHRHAPSKAKNNPDNCQTWSGSIADRSSTTGQTTTTPSAAIVTHVLVHEIGHHFGLSDEDMQAIEDSVD